ncbi:MAG: thioredoxin family protein [Longimicrobiales bacterium]|jgi:small redox-active disulfide protein 2|nr:thioredoxin family protein [Longimicrobiales bacterium]
MVKIEVLGPGCARCETLEKNVRAAVQEMEIEAEITKISQIKDIAARRVMMTPALAVNGRLVSSGHLLTVHQVKKLLEKAAQGDS